MGVIRDRVGKLKIERDIRDVEWAATMNLTKRAVESLAASGKDQLWWDSKLGGFSVKATAAGSKIFVLQYRMGGRGVSSRGRPF